MSSPAQRGSGDSSLLVAAEVTRLILTRNSELGTRNSESNRGSSPRLLLFQRTLSLGSIQCIPAFVISLLLAGCSPSPPSQTSGTNTPAPAKTDVEQLRRALGNIESYLTDLEGRVRTSTAQTWSQEASAAQHALGNIRIEIGTLRQGSQSVGNLESWLADLEGRLRGANPENWGENTTAARHIVGNVRIELQTLSRSLQPVSEQR